MRISVDRSSTPSSGSVAGFTGASAAARTRSDTARASSVGPKTRSTSPVAIDANGMPSNSAVSGSCTMTTPPASLMCRMPREPSLPVPDSTMPTARSFRSAARDLKNRSIGNFGVKSLLRSCSVSRNRPSVTTMFLPGGIR